METISIPPLTSKQPVGLVVILHSWGANAKDLQPLVPELALSNYHILLPNAPFAHPKVAGGYMWYDLEREDYQGLAQSQRLLTEWLKSLESFTKIPLASTIVMGFSQGGAMALDIGLHLPIAGLVSISGYWHRTPQEIEPPLPPVLIVHGRQDNVVPLRVAHRLRDYLLALGAPMQYKEVDMGHEIAPEVIEIVQDFIWVNSS